MNEQELLRGPGNCLGPSELEAYVEGRLPQVEAHVDACAACAHEVASLREFLAAEPRDSELADLKWVESRLAKPAPRRAWWSWIGASPSPRWAISLAAMLLVVAGALQLRHLAGPAPAEFGDSGTKVLRSSQVRLTGPLGDLESAPAEFQWEAVAGAVSYEVQVSEVDGSSLWRGTSSQTKLNAAADIQSLMLPRKTLVWRVKALGAGGTVLGESGAERFRVLPPAKR
jgi:hypothetical protein